MTPAAASIAHVILTLAALAGLLQLGRVLRHRGEWDPINRRFLFGLRVVTVIFLGRLMVSLTGVEAFRVLVLVGAGLVPLAVLLLAEGLLRRHAPGWAKRAIGMLTALFVITGLWFGEGIDPTRTWALLAFQLFGLALAGWLVIARDKESLSASENATAERLGLSLLLLIPLIAADYVMDLIGLPVQVSALGVLFLCWLAISLGQGVERHRGVMAAFATVVAAGLIGGAGLGLMAGLNGEGMVLAVVVALAAVLAGVVVNDGGALLVRERRLSLAAYLARGDVSDPQAILTGLRADPVVSGAVIIEGTELEGLGDLGELIGTDLLRQAALPVDPARREVADYIFQRYGASHAVALSLHPPRLLALNLPGLAAGARTETELAILGRMARMAGGTA